MSIVFYDMIAGMISYKTLNPKITEIFVSGTKVKTWFYFITQSYFEETKSLQQTLRTISLQKF